MEVTIEKERKAGTRKKPSDQFSDRQKTNSLCPVHDILERVSDKWSMHTIITLGKVEKMRFTELKKSIDGISQRMLTVTLRTLEEDGFITRTIYPEIPPRVEYALTDLGKSLMNQLIQLSDWANEIMGSVLLHRETFRKK